MPIRGHPVGPGGIDPLRFLKMRKKMTATVTSDMVRPLVMAMGK